MTQKVPQKFPTKNEPVEKCPKSSKNPKGLGPGLENAQI